MLGESDALRTGMPVSTEIMATALATPADGPSVGVAPSGPWTWTSVLSNSVGLIPKWGDRART